MKKQFLTVFAILAVTTLLFSCNNETNTLSNDSLDTTSNNESDTTTSSESTIEVKNEIIYELDSPMTDVKLILNENDMKYEFFVSDNMDMTSNYIQMVVEAKGTYSIQNDSIGFDTIDHYKLGTDLYGMDYDFGLFKGATEEDVLLVLNELLYIFDDYLYLLLSSDQHIYVPRVGSETPETIPPSPQDPSSITLIEVTYDNPDSLGGYGASVDVGVTYDEFLEKLSFRAEFSDGHSRSISNNHSDVDILEVTNLDLNTAGYQTVTVKFKYIENEYTCDVDVRVGVGTFQLSSVGLLNKCTVGTSIEDFVKEGKLSIYSSASSSGIVYNVPMTADMIEGFDSSQETAGLVKISYEFEGKVFSENTSVYIYADNNPGVYRIRPDSYDNVLCVPTGTKLSTLEQELEVYYFDSSSEMLAFSSEKISYAVYDENITGPQIVTLSVKNCSTELMVLYYDVADPLVAYVSCGPVMINVVNNEYYIMTDTPKIQYADGSVKAMIINSDYLANVEIKELVTMENFESVINEETLIKALMGLESPYITMHTETFEIKDFTLEVCIPFIFFDNFQMD